MESRRTGGQPLPREVPAIANGAPEGVFQARQFHADHAPYPSHPWNPSELTRWTRLSRAIDGVNNRIGRWTSWLCLLMVLVTAYNTAVRYLGGYFGFRLSSNLYLELQWYLFSLLFLLAAASALCNGEHVRVDILYSRLSARARAWIDLLGTVVLMIPFSAVTLWLSWPAIRNSWAVREISSDPGGLPRYPLRTFILVCFLLLIAQGISEIIKKTRILRGLRMQGNGASDEETDSEPRVTGGIA